MQQKYETGSVAGAPNIRLWAIQIRSGPAGFRAPERNTLRRAQGPSDELLPTVDVVRRAGERCGAHDGDGESGDVGWADHAADGQRRPQLIAALIESISEQRCRQRGVDEACSDEVHANRREFEREGRRERWQRGSGRRDDPETVTDAAAAGAPHEDQA